MVGWNTMSFSPEELKKLENFPKNLPIHNQIRWLIENKVPLLGWGNPTPHQMQALKEGPSNSTAAHMMEGGLTLPNK